MDKKEIKLLLVDDEPDIIKWMKKDLQSQSYIVYTALSGSEALEILGKFHVDVLIADIKMPHMDGIELIKHAKKNYSGLQCIVFTGHGELGTAIETIKLNAVDYLLKPVDKQELFEAIQKAVKARDEKKLLSRISIEKTPDSALQISEIEDVKKISSHNIMGQSKAIKRVFESIAQVSLSDSTVLITGESGTGKELVAKAIHENSHRCGLPFIVVNCAAIPDELLESELFGHVKGSYTGAIRDNKGKFEEAHKGTIFLDEIGDMPLGAQAKILRVLQEKKITRVGNNKAIKVDVRIIAATNKELKQAVDKDNFRADLYYRLNVFPIQLPPLRDRKEDIELLVKFFIKKLNPATRKEVKNISAKALEKLINYEWPGNIRELKNVVERALIKAKDQFLHEDYFDLPCSETLKSNQNQINKTDLVKTEDQVLKKENLNTSNNSPEIKETNKELISFIRRVILGKTSWKAREGYIFSECGKLKTLAEELQGNGSKMAEVLNVKKNNLNQMLNRCGIKLREIKSRHKSHH